MFVDHGTVMLLSPIDYQSHQYATVGNRVKSLMIKQELITHFDVPTGYLTNAFDKIERSSGDQSLAFNSSAFFAVNYETPVRDIL
jgi:hypothetical protein